MHTANISEVRNRLSHYLALVRRGERVLVCDRGRVIARIEPEGEDARAGAGGDEERVTRLERRGVLRRPSAQLPAEFFDRRPAVQGDLLLQAILDEREDGR